MPHMTDREPEDDLNLGLLLFIPYRFMESAVMDALREQGYDLTLTQARVFQRVDPGGVRMADLAQAAQLPKQTVGSVVDQLERAGYVRRTPDPRDARARRVWITERGRQLAVSTLPTVRRIEAAWRDHLGPERSRQLVESLTELRQVTDPYRRHRSEPSSRTESRPR
jgi:DNA-binding MarR family transcriptional regulator